MDKFIVSARKYRPANFADVVGQSSISTTLKNSILNKHLGHAYLFSGPRGVGKTTCARIFARTINCPDITESGEACNTCESCVSFNENRSYNIHELDAASNNSVDDIRVLTEQVRIPPQIGTYSVYIIDEVHMLSQSAFNAFLKTLEEPPAHAVFILATTEKHKIIPTILSRCQIFDFNRIHVEDAVAYLKEIADKESLGYEEDALHVIAQKADGAMRDALSIFDQVVSFSGEKITYRDVITNLNILDYDYFFRLTSSALEGDAPSMLLLFNEVLSKGFDARNFINGYAAHLRDLMVCKDPETVQLLEVGAGIREKYQQQSKEVPLQFLYEGLEICNQADIQFRASRNQRLTIELALVKLANLTGVQKKKELASADQQPLPESGEATERIPQASGDPEVRDKTESAKVASVPAGEEEKQEVQGNGNGSGRIIRNPGISIKGSLKEQAAQPGTDEADPAVKDGGTMTEVAGEQDENSAGEQPAGEATDPDQILEAWDMFTASVEKSQPRVYSTLKGNRPVVGSEGTIKLLLGSEAQRDHFVKHIRHDLVAYIRDSTGLEQVEIETGVTEAGQNGKKIYTDQDKLDFLMKKNPELGHLKSRFNLDFDD